LKSQIMLPMAATMLVALAAIGGWGAVLAGRGATHRIASQISQVARTLQETNFPLTDTVLRQMEALSGAALVYVDSAGRVAASGGGDEHLWLTDFAAKTPPRQVPSERFGPPSDDAVLMPLRNRTRVGEQGYFHTAVELTGRRGAGEQGTLHILYPEREYRRAWQRAIVPPLGFVILALPVVMLLSAVTAAKISARMRRLHGQVDRIADGDFQQLELSRRDDEIRALGQAVNRMAAMLSRYEAEVRRTERMRTLAHLGGGIAHQLRNSATGCNIALDLHAQSCPAGGHCESLAVAKRQLTLMDDYLQRFLQLGKASAGRTDEVVDIAALVEDLIPLIAPSARHAGVDLLWRPAERASTIVGDPQRLRQLMINLLVNAVEAAALGKARFDAAAEVIVELSDSPPDRIALSVSDTGPGPAESVRTQMFEPFVSGKPDGVGLGLSVAREVAEEHGGRIAWRREGNWTRFVVDLPCRATVELAALATSP
jgi:signal transduction histidine kinase